MSPSWSKSDRLNGDLFTLNNNVSPFQSNLSTTRSIHHCEEDFRDNGLRILHDLFEQSYRKLCKSPILTANSILSDLLSDLEALVETSLEVLLKVFSRDYLPTSGIEVYAILHFAYASAHYTSPHNMSTVHNELYADVTRWNLAVESRDRTLFYNIFNEIWYPQQGDAEAIPLIEAENSIDERRLNHGQLNGLPINPSLNPWHDLSAHCASPIICDQDRKNMLDGLLGSRVILMCRRYLDSIYSSPCM